MQITQALMSSDEEEEGNRTLTASVKRWWTGGRLEGKPVLSLLPAVCAAPTDSATGVTELFTDLWQPAGFCYYALCVSPTQSPECSQSTVILNKSPDHMT